MIHPDREHIHTCHHADERSPGSKPLTGHAAERLFPLHCHEDRYRKPLPLHTIIPATIFIMDLSYFLFNYYNFLLFCICSVVLILMNYIFLKCCGGCSTIFSQLFDKKYLLCVIFPTLSVFYSIFLYFLSVTHTFSMCVHRDI